jgi:hypothetical protein
MRPMLERELKIILPYESGRQLEQNYRWQNGNEVYVARECCGLLHPKSKSGSDLEAARKRRVWWD